MRFLILGHSGQLGKEICMALESSEHKFELLDYRRCELDSSEKLSQQLKLLDFDVFVNAVAWTDVDAAESHVKETFRINAFWPRNLAKALLNIEKTFIHISTDYVFSGESNIPWQVDSEPSPINVYGESKAKAEEFIQQINPYQSYIFRTSWLYSPFRKNFVKTMIKSALKDDCNLKVVDDQIGQPTSAKDLAIQIIKSIEENIKPGIYHATNSGEASWNSFARKIFTLIGENPDRIESISSDDVKRIAKRPIYSVLSHDCWIDSDIKPMKNWQLALEEQINIIKSAVLMEGI